MIISSRQATRDDNLSTISPIKINNRKDDQPTRGQFIPSHAVQVYMRRDVPGNTNRSTRTSIWALQNLLVLENGRHGPIPSTETIEPSTGIFDNLRSLLFPSDDGNSYRPTGWEKFVEVGLIHIRNHLLEFIVHYRSKHGKQVSVETMTSYIHGFQRCFQSERRYEMNILRRPILGFSNSGIYTVMDHLFRELQSHGKFTISHNILILDSITTLYRSPCFSKNEPKSFLTRIIFFCCSHDFATANGPR